MRPTSSKCPDEDGIGRKGAIGPVTARLLEVLLDVKHGEFHQVEEVSVKERFERYPPMAQDLPSFLQTEVMPEDPSKHLPELF